MAKSAMSAGIYQSFLCRGIAVSDCARCHTPLPLDGRFCSHCGTPSGEPDHVCPPGSTDELKQRLAHTVEGRYEIISLLGRGGMAVVFLAQDLVLERQVAIKILPPEMSHDPQLILRFQQEAKTAAKLDHPNIIPIHRVESEEGLVYFVMKYVSGHSLEDLLAQGPLPIPLVRHVLRDAALALGHAHRRHIVHRDVKPANIMLEDDGRVILTDFGISKAAQGSSQLTGAGTIIGTPHYMAPEQARGQEVDGRADQYALAIVGHRILTGKLPFEGEAHSILYQQVFEAPPPVVNDRPDTPPDLRAALEKALSKEPKDRFATMEQFASAVIGERRGATTVVTAPVKAVPPRRRGRGIIFLALVGAIVAAGWLGLHAKSSPTASRPVRRQPTVPSQVQLVPGKKGQAGGAAKVRPVQYTLLRVESDPWAMLYIDGVEIGLTPVRDYRLPLGTHRLRLEQKGYRTKAETIVVKGTGPIVRRYSLQRGRGRR